MTGDQTERWRNQAIAWLAKDFLRVRRKLGRVDTELADKAIAADRRAFLENERVQLRRYFKWARDGDADLANLRGRPDFKALFPD